tara:strand:+ start:729 stop:1829 length:1101 start_codon:yes stop_codon:yes gene_type:complete
MINTIQFVSQLSERGFTHICAVPCSFGKDFINAVINSTTIQYIPCASEAIAASTAVGLRIAGAFPIVFIQSSGACNLGSCLTSLSNPYSVFFPIICSWRTYKDGDSEIQHKHLAQNLTNLICAYGYSYKHLPTDDLNSALDIIDQANKSFLFCLLHNGTFTPVDLDVVHQLSSSDYPSRMTYMREILQDQRFQNYLLIATTGHTSRELSSLDSLHKRFYMAGNMGGALSLGLGTLLAGKSTLVFGGDAEFVMHMGGMTTVGRYQHLSPPKPGMLIYILFDNFSNKSTGGQRTYQDHINYCEIATSSGLISLGSVSTLNGLSKALSSLDSIDYECKTYFIHVKCSFDPIQPRPELASVLQSTGVFEE